MSGSTRSRQKHKLEPISIEELAGTTGMSGFCTFLTRDNSIAVPALDHLGESGAPESDASESMAPQSSAPLSQVEATGASDLSPVNTRALERSAPLIGPPRNAREVLEAAVILEQSPEIPSAPESRVSDSGALDLPAFESDAPDTAALEIDPLDSFPRRRIRIREASTVQDAHSLAEQAVYDAMYRAGRPYRGDSRVLTIGLRTLAEFSRMAYSNCKANVRSLVTKLAIDEQPGFSYTEGRTYVVYSFREILRRRKAAGLTHVIRTRGVAFVNPRTGLEIILPYAPDSGAPELSASHSSAGHVSATKSISSALPSTTQGAPTSVESGAPVSGAHIENRHLLRNITESSSSLPAMVVTVLRQYVSDVDDDAASQLWRRCTDNAPDASPEEVAHFVHLKASKTGIRTPFGFLLTAVPKCFIGDSFRQFRDERARNLQTAAARDRQFAAEILKSPEADDEQKQWAREVLSL
jgi:hypothetical protein